MIHIKYKVVHLLNCFNKNQDKSSAPEVYLFSFTMIIILTAMHQTIRYHLLNQRIQQ